MAQFATPRKRSSRRSRPFSGKVALIFMGAVFEMMLLQGSVKGIKAVPRYRRTLSRRSIMTIPVGKYNIQSRESPVSSTGNLYIILAVSTKCSIPHHGARSFMTARIFKPAKNAMQSGTAKTKEWQLDFEPEQPRAIEPLMGWTSSTDMKQQLTLRFETKEEAVAYCEREGIPYQVIEPKEPARRQAAYADNFAFRRGEPWTH